MTRLKYRISIWLIMCCTATGSLQAQQNVQFSQYVFNGLSVNPAYAGYKGDWYLNTIYRHQWVGIPGAPRTGAISVDGLTNAKDDKVGVGLQVMFDKLGPQEALSAYASYSYRIPLDDADTRRLCIGLGAGITQYSIDGKALTYVDDLDEAIPAGKTSVRIPDARFGVYYYTSSFYAGVSVMDLFSLYTDNSKYYWNGYSYKVIKKTQHMYLTTGFLWKLSEHLQLKPSLLVKEDFKGPTNVDLNAFLLIEDKIWLGASYRTGMRLWNKPQLEKGLDPIDAASFMVEYYAGERFRFGYAYDLTINKMASQQQGSHEISIGVFFTNRNNRLRVSSPRYF
ncbi:type IX secretion system membrane protein PorP/SprF [Chitinophaga sp. SYP-B3965]|uniref:PorP/SprF family type IX secretion system membrane protein n=1 Tax=Chitinophaga sp. SYP-B3965 TaxID=2663120 RepID=UPI001299ADD5|nr:type IX secretion system membrane protein PorP/SprF [Chitinophaga sp. SYP-B3965]MRG47772.1 type IX secretion system membrane protein PorP/SprF [Chitinophaga sp. SYP-B3965]